MNTPAAKEPSMDEILSSIRQIIAEDDAGAVKRPVTSPDPIPARATPAPVLAAQEPDRPSKSVPEAPMALSEHQIVAPQDTDAQLDEDVADAAFDELEIGEAVAIEVDEAPAAEVERVDPDDIGFEGEVRMGQDEVAPEPSARAERPAKAAEPPRSNGFRVPPPRPAPSPERPGSSSGMPDPELSRDMAEELLEPATQAAVRHTLGRLNAMEIGTQGLTIEHMVREMLRPMLKDWLDENLPSVVERMVEREIERISRGSAPR